MQVISRKLNRLPDYDYSEEGFYFVTICTKGKKEWFGEIENGEMVLSRVGKFVEQQWLWLEERYSFVDLDVYAVMPNHFHGILIIENDVNVGTTLGLSLRNRPNIYSRQKNLLSKSICAFKTTSSKLIHQSGLNEFAWQRSFYDHVIRNEFSLNEIREYIINNPLQWQFDVENAHHRRDNPRVVPTKPPVTNLIKYF